MPNFASIHDELLALWRYLQNFQSATVNYEARIQTLEEKIQVQTAGSIQGDGSAGNKIRLTDDVTIPDQLIVSGSTILGTTNGLFQNATINLGQYVGELTVKNLGNASTIEGYKLLTINDSNGQVKKQSIDNIIVGAYTAYTASAQFSTPGTSVTRNLTIPSDAKNIKITCVGGGGGGGRANSGTSGGGAGGGGGYVSVYFHGSFLAGQQIKLVAGSPGEGKTGTAGIGDAGGSSYVNFGSVADIDKAFVVATGGRGGNATSSDGANGSNNGSNQPYGNGGTVSIFGLVNLDVDKNGAYNSTSNEPPSPIFAPGGGGGGVNIAAGRSVVKGGAGGAKGINGAIVTSPAPQNLANGSPGGNGASINFSIGDTFIGAGGGGGPGGDYGSYTSNNGEDTLTSYGNPGNGGKGGWPGGGGGGHGRKKYDTDDGDGGNGGGGFVLVEVWS